MLGVESQIERQEPEKPLAPLLRILVGLVDVERELLDPLSVSLVPHLQRYSLFCSRLLFPISEKVSRNPGAAIVEIVVQSLIFRRIFLNDLQIETRKNYVVLHG